MTMIGYVTPPKDPVWPWTRKPKSNNPKH